MMQEHGSVLIVGAGGAGLSLSLLLLQQGIRPLLVERRADISIYPRARNLTFRSLEVFRGLGLAAEVHAATAIMLLGEAAQPLSNLLWNADGDLGF